NRCARVQEGLEVVGDLDAFRADPLFRPAHVVDAVTRLNRRNRTERLEPRLVLCAYDLGMLDPRPAIAHAALALELLEDVEDHGVGAVADGVNRELESGRVG